MSFEDDFPSLKGKLCIDKEGTLMTLTTFAEAFFIEDIREHCLDKAKVRAALEKMSDSAPLVAFPVSEYLKKELGL